MCPLEGTSFAKERPRTEGSNPWPCTSLCRLNVLFSALDDLNDVLVATLGSWRTLQLGVARRFQALTYWEGYKLQHLPLAFEPRGPMNLVDLPGLVQADAGLAAQTKQLLERYTQGAQDQDIFLAVVPATEAPANWAVMQLIKDKHLEERTIGVITKFDRQERVRMRCALFCQPSRREARL